VLFSNISGLTIRLAGSWHDSRRTNGICGLGINLWYLSSFNSLFSPLLHVDRRSYVCFVTWQSITIGFIVTVVLDATVLALSSVSDVVASCTSSLEPLLGALGSPLHFNLLERGRSRRRRRGCYIDVEPLDL
jgi:hypothetical protein